MAILMVMMVIEVIPITPWSLVERMVCFMCTQLILGRCENVRANSLLSLLLLLSSFSFRFPNSYYSFPVVNSQPTLDPTNSTVNFFRAQKVHQLTNEPSTAKASFVSPHTMPVRALLNTGSTSSSNVARSLLISSDTSGLILIWDVRSRTVVHALLGHSSTVPLSALLVLEADEVGQTEALLISGSYDGTVRAWGLNTGKELWAPKAGEEGTPEEDLEGTRGNGPNDMKDKEAELKTLEEKEKKPLKEDEEEIEEENEEEDRKENEDKPNAIFTAVGLGGGLIATGGMGGEVRIWDFKFE